MAQRVGRRIVLLFHDRGIRRGRVVSSTLRPHFTPGKEPVPILQEVGWAPGPVWTGEKSRPHWDSMPDRPACSQSPYRLSYPAHIMTNVSTVNLILHATIGTTLARQNVKMAVSRFDESGVKFSCAALRKHPLLPST